MAHYGGATRPRNRQRENRGRKHKKPPTGKATKGKRRTNFRTTTLRSFWSKLPDLSTLQRHDTWSMFSNSQSPERRYVGLHEFGATVQDIGPGRPKFPEIFILNLPFNKIGPMLYGPIPLDKSAKDQDIINHDPVRIYRRQSQ
ncbi:hypothetical protein PIB30_096054 [Stylosanthes scabra]|uniref:Capsid protein n=1 Tax=Stylosanthes scabra TaxID=79078 RepID=A0ABU6VUA8_9FABA|nr:hypothetical protein [Stylosanthes scabra]